MFGLKKINNYLSKWYTLPEYGSENRYSSLRRNITLLMLIVTLLPLIIMAGINYHQYRKSIKSETINQLKVLENKTKHTFELFLQERLSAVKYIAHAYSFDQLSDKGQLKKIFYTMQENFSGFVDIGLINQQGKQVNYVGPYYLEGKDYTGRTSYQEVKVKGTYISDVFMGYRKFPHLVISVEKRNPNKNNYVVRSTIDIDNFNDIVASMGLDSESDAFLLNKKGIIQTPSKFYGDVLDNCTLEIPSQSFQPTVLSTTDSHGRQIFMSYVYFTKLEFILVIVKPWSKLLQSWYALKGQLITVFLISTVVIFLLIFKIADKVVKRIRQADMKRESAFRELEHNQKLSSIGRMAAGIAHEINNPLAIINEKTGLMQDLIQYQENFPQKDKFLGLAYSILRSVERARSITYRLLGFARRLEVQFEMLDINKVLKEVLGFLEKEAQDRNIDLRLHMDPDLPKIPSDQGQLEQVFLNILTNALAAVEDGGRITIRTWSFNEKMLAVVIQDNGCGMSKETKKHIFEPFFTTKKGYGTGLGLSITYGIVKKLGGEIEVESQESSGTKFYIYLPRKKESNGGNPDE